MDHRRFPRIKIANSLRMSLLFGFFHETITIFEDNQRRQGRLRLVAISGKLASKCDYALPSTDDGVDAFLKSALRYRLASGFLASALSEVPTRKVHYGKTGEDAARRRLSFSRQAVGPL